MTRAEPEMAPAASNVARDGAPDTARGLSLSDGALENNEIGRTTENSGRAPPQVEGDASAAHARVGGERGEAYPERAGAAGGGVEEPDGTVTIAAAGVAGVTEQCIGGRGRQRG